MKSRKKTPRLSSDHMESLIAWLKEKGDDFKCPVCGHDHFTVSDRLVAGIIHGKETMIGSGYYPLILSHCNNCHFSFHFLAKPILGESIVEDLIWEEDDD